MENNVRTATPVKISEVIAKNSDFIYYIFIPAFLKEAQSSINGSRIPPILSL